MFTKRVILRYVEQTFTCSTYIVFLEVAHVANHTDPNKHGACAEEDAAHIIACKDLFKRRTNRLIFLPRYTSAYEEHVSRKVLITLVWISILRMEPMMVSVSLTMIRIYQPLTNSILSDHGTSLPECTLQCWTYSCFWQIIFLFLSFFILQTTMKTTLGFSVLLGGYF